MPRQGDFKEAYIHLLYNKTVNKDKHVFNFYLFVYVFGDRVLCIPRCPLQTRYVAIDDLEYLILIPLPPSH